MAYQEAAPRQEAKKTGKSTTISHERVDSHFPKGHALPEAGHGRPFCHQAETWDKDRTYHIKDGRMPATRQTAVKTLQPATDKRIKGWNKLDKEKSPPISTNTEIRTNAKPLHTFSLIPGSSSGTFWIGI